MTETAPERADLAAIRAAMRRAHAEAAPPPRRRMAPSERNAILGVAFVLVGWIGLSLAFPYLSWWVSGLIALIGGGMVSNGLNKSAAMARMADLDRRD